MLYQLLGFTTMGLKSQPRSGSCPMIEMEDKQMTLGQRIRMSRQRLELTQQQVAGALGLSPQHISAIEQDKRAPSLPSLAKLAEELGVTIDFLVTGKEGIITDTIPAIKADKRLTVDWKRALITLVQTLHNSYRDEEAGSAPV